jgi:signal transduction histidine kinase
MMIAPANLQCTQTGYTNMESAAQSNSSLLQELGSDLVFIQDASGQYRSFYWQNAHLHGLINEQMVGQTIKDEFSPVALAAYREQVQRILEDRTPERCVHAFCYQGHCYPFELVISPILQGEGKATSVMVMGRLLPETSIQKVIDSMVPLSLDPNQKLLTQIARKIRRTLDLDTIWEQTVKNLGKALQVSRCIVYSYKPEHLELKVEAEYSQDGVESMVGKKLSLQSQPYLTQAIFSHQPVLVDQAQTNSLDPQSILVVATCYQDEPNGLISLQQCDRTRQWSEAEIELVRELAEQVGTAIAHGTLYKELELASERAEEASRLKSEFLANTSHELRTPLNGMLGFLKLVLEGMADDPEEQREFIQEAYRSAIHLLNLINDILDIAKIEAGKLELELGPVKLDELMNNVDDFTRNQAQQKKLSLNIELPDVRDEVILYGNYQRLLQVLLNLVGNAIKFTHEGGVTISAEVVTKKITFKDMVLPGLVKVRVADTGIGVALDKQDRLFQSFSQVDGSLTRSYGGTGLGLAISQRLVETMGGVVNFYSMGEGLGSTVTFTVPLYQAPVMSSSND